MSETMRVSVISATRRGCDGDSVSSERFSARAVGAAVIAAGLICSAALYVLPGDSHLFEFRGRWSLSR
jgi:hypothetical protein